MSIFHTDRAREMELEEFRRKHQDNTMKMIWDNITGLWKDSADNRKAMEDIRARLKNLEDAVYEMQNGMMAEVLHRDMKEVMAQHRPLTELEKEPEQPETGARLLGMNTTLRPLPCPACEKPPQIKWTYDENGILYYNMVCAGSDHFFAGMKCRTADHAVLSWNNCVRGGMFWTMYRCICTGTVWGDPQVHAEPLYLSDAEPEEKEDRDDTGPR